MVAWIWAEVGEGKKEEKCCQGKNEFEVKSLLESILSWDSLCEMTGKLSPLGCWRTGLTCLFPLVFLSDGLPCIPQPNVLQLVLGHSLNSRSRFGGDSGRHPWV